MGLCLSSGAAAEAARAAAAAPRDTALVLLPDGDLREYPRPVTAARVLDDAPSSSSASGDWILCDADRMGFEGPVTAVPAAEPLRAGQIYFVLPAAAAGRRGLSREEVAALAVRASAALSRSAAASGSAGRRRRGAVAPLVFAPPEEEQDEEVNEVERALAHKAAAQRRLKRRPTPRPGRRIERFASDLTAIPECEMASE
ncbi:hypothetical protein HU200_016359 [Digitaria exilis]|uniref:Uncharacterized protein n=1 Tax=Digitaria exilis TaxID=1010633 RepID=A0A835F829_9POAL|nr:hypothetical protein HU200_016359 [Digitaria exilis]CAB3455603.1 unnamed protein product [Digitaria exilis]